MVPHLQTVDSQFPQHLADRRLFKSHPERRFLARPYQDGDGPFSSKVPLFDNDGTGELAEINLVIVKRIAGGRHRALFAAWPLPSLKSDQEIIGFLRSRRIDPENLKKVRL